VIALFGPTGVGKTAVAIALAERLRARGERPVAVSADALQVYRGLEILTGAATSQERRRLEHRLISFLAVTETFSAGRYAELAHREIDALVAQDARPIVVGGTGLYLRAALADLDLAPPPPAALRQKWTERLEREGPASLHAELSRRAPQAADRLRPTDSQRLVRALELAELDALPAHGTDSQLWTTETRHPTRLIGLTMQRVALRARIDARVEAMVAAGAEDEVRAADAAGASPTARSALGFAELLAGDAEAMKRRTRQYARRQLTWMRKLPNVALVDVTDRGADDVAVELEKIIDRDDRDRLGQRGDV